MSRPETNFSGPELCAITAREAVRRLRAGEVTPNELLDAALRRMDEVEPAINATVIRCGERARAAIGDLDRHGRSAAGEPGWLAGLPVGIKDLIDVAGLPTTCGSPALVNNVPKESDALVERLEARGAIIAGKMNTPEFGAGGNTFNAVFGMTRNPWYTAMNAGGSSGGSAAALATGEVFLAHGSDLAGSLRTPASFCGVVGFRPSPGRCGGGPADMAFAPEAVDGPMARDIRDTALLLDAMCGFDPRHPISLEAPATPFQSAIRNDPGPIRIAYAEDQNGFAPVEGDIRDVLGSAMKTVERVGAGVTVEAACPELPTLNETYLTLRGVHYGAVADYLPAEARRHFKRTLRENAEFGRNLEVSEIFLAFRNKSRLYEIMRRFLERYDVLALPVTGIAPGPVEIEYPPVVAGVEMGDYVEWLRFSFLATTTGLPSLSMPAGFTAGGLPVGIQLIGPPRGEARLLQVALAVEERLNLPVGPIDPIV